jgi:hypothetical protein
VLGFGSVLDAGPNDAGFVLFSIVYGGTQGVMMRLGLDPYLTLQHLNLFAEQLGLVQMMQGLFSFSIFYVGTQGVMMRRG